MKDDIPLKQRNQAKFTKVNYLFYSFIDQVVQCCPHCWPQCTCILFLLSVFFYMLVRIIWQFHLIMMEVFQLIVSNHLDSTCQLLGSIFYLWTTQHVLLSRTTAFVIPWSHLSLCFALKLSHFWMCSCKDFPIINLYWALHTITNICSSFIVVASSTCISHHRQNDAIEEIGM